jgi:hypothetical protein
MKKNGTVQIPARETNHIKHLATIKIDRDENNKYNFSSDF